MLIQICFNKKPIADKHVRVSGTVNSHRIFTSFPEYIFFKQKSLIFLLYFPNTCVATDANVRHPHGHSIGLAYIGRKSVRCLDMRPISIQFWTHRVTSRDLSDSCRN